MRQPQVSDYLMNLFSNWIILIKYYRSYRPMYIDNNVIHGLKRHFAVHF